MKEHRTLVLDEEAPTKVDLGRPRATPPDARTDPESSSGPSRSRVRVLVGASLVVLIVGLLSVGRQEQRNSRAIRQILEELRRERTAVSLSKHSDPTAEGSHHRFPDAVLEAAPDPATMESRRQLETEAAAALLAHDYRRAFSLYQALARVSREPVFAHVVAILEGRVRCSAEHEAAGDLCP